MILKQNSCFSQNSSETFSSLTFSECESQPVSLVYTKLLSTMLTIKQTWKSCVTGFSKKVTIVTEGVNLGRV